MAEGFRVRRVVTGHDENLRAIVLSDETIAAAAPRPGQEACVVWADAIPADNLAAGDGADRANGARLPGGGVFRIVRYAAGARGNMHRTQTLDYGIVISGSLSLELDDGIEAVLNAGDVIVQRGTIHRWSNPGPDACTVAFVLLDARALPKG